jgi:predicted small lipoprotein YifL
VFALAGCGQSGALYLPVVPPMPKPLPPEQGSEAAHAAMPANAASGSAAPQVK